MLILIVGLSLSSSVNIQEALENIPGVEIRQSAEAPKDMLCDDPVWKKEVSEKTEGDLNDVVPSSSARGKILPASKTTPFLTHEYDIKPMEYQLSKPLDVPK